ncbi:MAG: hypothetical protein Q4P18_04290 [Methanobrevibacter sp.]|uniref:hypothetical protein n=1 Tax=Methanobrevibacter sp. TaxID=66852 RepID=UPI0026E0C1B7|nr:hypothetical protein [Methanobrevibacter sp.]MDO5848731.1 hypothetical protein [Methanobrevibacter sp.]
MNINSLRRIEEVVVNSGIWSFLEIAQDTIYLDFLNVELGNPKIDDELSLSVRFADNSFIMFFYSNIWDLEFLSDFNHNTLRIDANLDFKIKNFKFLDFEYLHKIVNDYSKSKLITLIEDFDINNLRNDFFLIFEIDEIAVVVGGNQMDFFNKSEKLDDHILKELSNQWMIYFLDYKSQRKMLNKDPMCENHLKENRL